jgi:hypothetical protein
MHSLNHVDYRNTDFVAYWLAGHMVTTGQNPYSPEEWQRFHQLIGSTWIPDRTFVYPLPTALFFAPFGLLPLKWAYAAWIFLSQCFVAFSLLLLLKPKEEPRNIPLFLPLVVAVMLYRPMMLIVHNGQLSALLLMIVSGSIYCYEKKCYWRAGALLPLMVLKPNIGLPVIVCLSALVLCRRRYASFTAGVLSTLAIAGFGFLQNPHWLTDFLQAGYGRLKDSCLHTPTIWGLAALLPVNSSPAILYVGAVAGMFIVTGTAVLIRRYRNGLQVDSMVSLIISLMLLLTPYTWPYDQILLLVPLVTSVTFMVRAGCSYLLSVCFMLGLAASSIVLLLISSLMQAENINALLPAVTLCLTLWQIKKQSWCQRSVR